MNGSTAPLNSIQNHGYKKLNIINDDHMGLLIALVRHTSVCMPWGCLAEGSL